MKRIYGETTVKELREALSEFDDKDIVEIVAHGSEWASAELKVVKGKRTELLMEVDW